MKRVKIVDAVGKEIPLLTSRKSAHNIKDALERGDAIEDSNLFLDFAGAEGVAPSFLDEALLIAEEYAADSGNPRVTVIFGRPPTVLAAKHHAIARAHGRTLVVTENGDWEFRKN